MDQMLRSSWTWLKSESRFRYCWRYCSMKESSSSVQSARVCPEVPFLRQCMFKTWGMVQLSYSELRIKKGPWMKGQVFSINKQRHYYPGYLLLQALEGVGSSELASLKIFRISFSNFLYPVVVGQLRNTPESEIVYTLLGSPTNSFTQLFQLFTAMPPADIPVRMTFSAALSPYLASIQLRCPLVIAAPLKNRLVPLYRIASLLKPWWREPSQQGRKNLVQLAKALIEELRERYPCAKQSGSSLGQTVEVPRQSLDLWQQLSSVFSRVVSPQLPPPKKKIIIFLGSPSCTQSKLGLPSRHLASGSQLWTTFLQLFWLVAKESRRKINSGKVSGTMNIFLIGQNKSQNLVSYPAWSIFKEG